MSYIHIPAAHIEILNTLGLSVLPFFPISCLPLPAVHTPQHSSVVWHYFNVCSHIRAYGVGDGRNDTHTHRQKMRNNNSSSGNGSSSSVRTVERQRTNKNGAQKCARFVCIGICNTKSTKSAIGLSGCLHNAHIFARTKLS